MQLAHFFRTINVFQILFLFLMYPTVKVINAFIHQQSTSRVFVVLSKKWSKDIFWEEMSLTLQEMNILTQFTRI